MRRIYDQWNVANNFQAAPVKGRLSEVAQALVSCSDVGAVHNGDPAWQVERFAYDAYGNQTVHHVVGAADGSQDRWTKTDYDGFYHLFPVKVYDGVRTEFAEKASYYGVNAVSSGESKGWGDAWSYWGTMAEWCDVNDVCARQAYDSHGRRTLAWENVPAGAGWGSLTASNPLCLY